MTVSILSFTSQSCVPCGPVKSILKNIQNQYSVTVDIIDVDEQPSLPQQYNVQGIPALVFVSNNQPTTYLSGSKINYASVAQILEGLGLHRTKT